MTNHFSLAFLYITLTIIKFDLAQLFICIICSPGGNTNEGAGAHGGGGWSYIATRAVRDYSEASVAPHVGPGELLVLPAIHVSRALTNTGYWCYDSHLTGR